MYTLLLYSMQSSSTGWVDLHLVASPHRITGALHQHVGRYDYGHLAVFVFDAEKDSFDAIVPFRDEVRRRTLHRCN